MDNSELKNQHAHHPLLHQIDTKTTGIEAQDASE